MKCSFDLETQLEDLCFKYERMCALVTCLQHIVAEKIIEVRGVPDNTMDFALYEIETELRKSNEIFGKLLKDAEFLKE